jgi:regulator of RNase E activity RraA
MTTRAIFLGAAGAVVNGYSRDTNQIQAMKFLTFSAGTYAQDQCVRGKVIDYHITIEWNGIFISPGDIIYGDRDGVLVVPSVASTEAFSVALEKARSEKLVEQALKDGMSTVEAFATFGVM